MTIPPAPSWIVVFMTGAVVNAIQQCWWGAGVCLGASVILKGIDHINKVTSDSK